MPHQATPLASSVQLAESITPASPFAALPPDTRILFVMQPHSQGVGGIQRLSRRLYEAMRLVRKTHLIDPVSLGGLKAGMAPPRRSGLPTRTLIYCDSAVAAIFATRLFARRETPIVATVHGLDLIAPLAPYQKLVARALQRLDRVICVSAATAVEAEKRGVPKERITIIPNPAEHITEPAIGREQARGLLKNELGMDCADRKVLFSVGRPVARKGFAEFIRHTFPLLPDDYIYVIAGPVVRAPRWIELAGKLLSTDTRRNTYIALGYYSSHDELLALSKHPRVFYLNGISDYLRDVFLRAADMFVQPNISVPGDMEGFGMVALEAAVRGLPVVASAIEGITEAVIDGKNGLLIPSGDNCGMAATITSLLADRERSEAFGERARTFTLARFSSDRIYAGYAAVFNDLLDNHLSKRA